MSAQALRTNLVFALLAVVVFLSVVTSAQAQVENIKPKSEPVKITIADALNAMPRIAKELRSVAGNAGSKLGVLKIGQSIQGRKTVRVAQSEILTELNITSSFSYEARPHGGILSVRVDVAPAFSGIGVALRPLASRSFTVAVDDIDDAMIAGYIDEAAQDLFAEQLATK